MNFISVSKIEGTNLLFIWNDLKNMDYRNNELIRISEFTNKYKAIHYKILL